MLPAYIIHDILERERARRSELPEERIDLPDNEPPGPKDEGEATTERGVAILDFTI
jgi:hypothetical protein